MLRVIPFDTTSYTIVSFGHYRGVWEGVKSTSGTLVQRLPEVLWDMNRAVIVFKREF